LRERDVQSKIARPLGEEGERIMTPRGFAGLALVVALAWWGAAKLGNPSHVKNTAASIAERRPTSSDPAVVTTVAPVSEAAAGDSTPPVSVVVPPNSFAAEVPDVDSVSTDPGSKPTPQAGTPLASVPTSDPVNDGPKPPTETGMQFASVPTSDPVKDGPQRQPQTGMQLASVPTSDPVNDGPKPPTETGKQLASVPGSDPVDDGAKPPVRAIESPDQCVTDTCIDAYLWSRYERTPKVDTVKVPQKIKVTVKKKGKTRTVTQTVMTYVVEDFTWKDPAAAQRGGMSLMDYVIGGMDRGFKLKLYRALRAMDDAGLMPGITSGFRDDYRQSIAAGNKAAPDSSYHGGSRRGGYGHGLACDVVSVKGDNRMQRYAASDEMWKWIDAHEKELGIGRPYLDRDPPHVGPIDGTEYTVKRALANMHKRASPTKKSEKPQLKTARQLAAHKDSGVAKHAHSATLSKLTSLQKRSTLPR